MRSLLVVAILVIAALLVGHFLRPGSVPDRGPPADTAPADAAAAGGGLISPASPRDDAALEREAQEYVRDITHVDSEPVSVDDADRFMVQDQSLSLIPDRVVEEVTAAQLQADTRLTPDTPITVVRETEEIQVTNVQRILERAGGNLDKRVRVLQGDAVSEVTVGELLNDQRVRRDDPVTVVKRGQHLEVLTTAELLEEKRGAPDAPLKIIREPYRLEAATVGELVSTRETVETDTVFYVRTISEGDSQGIWGIIHRGLIENFARGIAIRRGENLETYQVDIPEDADETTNDRASSFLGKLIFDKTAKSYVYNYRQGRIGQNSDLVFPGQEVVIIRFTPDELVAIYKHFVAQHSG